MLAKEISAFGVVGVVNLFVDVGLFNLLHFRVGLGPTTSNVLSAGVATTISYFANRHWSFSHRARTGLRREYTLFILINLLALGISSVVIAFTLLRGRRDRPVRAQRGQGGRHRDRHGLPLLVLQALRLPAATRTPTSPRPSLTARRGLIRPG